MIDALLATYTKVDFWREVSVAIVATLILGGIGLLIKKFGPKILNRFLSVLTLGNERAKRRIYQRISTLHHSGYSEFIAHTSLYILIGILIIGYISMDKISGTARIQALADDIQSTETKLWTSFEYQDPPEHQTEFELLNKIEKQKEKISEIASNNYQFILLWRFLLAFLALTFLYKYATLSYVNAAQAHFKKALDLCGPFISDEMRRTYISQFAKVESKRDYEMVLDSISDVLKKKNEAPPVFNIW